MISHLEKAKKVAKVNLKYLAQNTHDDTDN